MCVAPFVAGAQNIVLPEEIITEAPEGEVVYYNRVGTSIVVDENHMVIEIPQEGQIEVIQGTDGYVYLKDLVSNFDAGTYVRGTQDGDVITIPMGQLVKHYEGVGIVDVPFNAQLWYCNITRNMFGHILLSSQVTRDTSVAEMTYLIAGGNLIQENDDPNHAVGVFYDDTNRWAGFADYGAEIPPMPEPEAIQPAMPTILTYDFSSKKGNEIAYMTLDVPCVPAVPTEEMKKLDPDLLGYVIYLNDAETKFELTPDVYEGLAEATTEVPFTFENGVQIVKDENNSRLISFQLITSMNNCLDRVGIQSVYHNNVMPVVHKWQDSDEAYATYSADPIASNIYWMPLKTEVAVEDVNAAKTVASTSYINAAGLQSQKPFEGMNIVVRTYTDGTTQVTKVVK